MTHPCPPLPLPEPLRGAETGTFTHRTITVRLPNIARSTLEYQGPSRGEQPLTASAWRDQALIAEIPALVHPHPGSGLPRRPIGSATCSPTWDRLAADPWFFAEMYFYRHTRRNRIFQPGGLECGSFARFKSGKGWKVEAYDAGGLAPGLARPLAGPLQRWGPGVSGPRAQLDLWGNQADLACSRSAG
jgi:hypothetical protein